MTTSTSNNNTRRKSDFSQSLSNQLKGKIKLVFYPCCSFRETVTVEEALKLLEEVILDFNERSFARVLDENYQVIAIKSHKGISLNEGYKHHGI